MYVIEDLNKVDKRGFTRIKIYKTKPKSYNIPNGSNHLYLVDKDRDISAELLPKLSNVMAEIIYNKKIKAYRVPVDKLLKYISNSIKDYSDIKQCNGFYLNTDMTKLLSLNTNIIYNKIDDNNIELYFTAKSDAKCVFSNIDYGDIPDFLKFAIDNPRTRFISKTLPIVVDWFNDKSLHITKLYNYIEKYPISKFDMLTKLVRNEPVEIIPINKICGYVNVIDKIYAKYYASINCDIMRFFAYDSDSLIIPTMFHGNKSKGNDGICILIDADVNNHEEMFEKLDHIASYIIDMSRRFSDTMPNLLRRIQAVRDNNEVVTIDTLYELIEADMLYNVTKDTNK